MKAYKGFNSNLDCTRGQGTFHYEVGKTYKEDSAKCASKGFHCVEQPLDVLSWYDGYGARYCEVEAGGDINEDGDDRISCTEMTIVKEYTLEQIGLLECLWLKDHPERKPSIHVKENFGQAYEGGIVVVRGRNPKAKGEINSAIFLIKVDRYGEAVKIGGYVVDGKECLPGKVYNVLGRCVG